MGRLGHSSWPSINRGRWKGYSGNWGWRCSNLHCQVQSSVCQVTLLSKSSCIWKLYVSLETFWWMWFYRPSKNLGLTDEKTIHLPCALIGSICVNIAPMFWLMCVGKHKGMTSRFQNNSSKKCEEKTCMWLASGFFPHNLKISFPRWHSLYFFITFNWKFLFEI